MLDIEDYKTENEQLKKQIILLKKDNQYLEEQIAYLEGQLSIYKTASYG